MDALNKYVIAWVMVVGEPKCVAELVEAAHGKGEFCVKIERGGGEATVGAGELRGERELEAELGLAGAAFGYQLRY